MNGFIKDKIIDFSISNSVDPKSLFQSSYLLQYLDKKTQSVDRSSKARGSFANIYAIYVLVEDYINKGYLSSNMEYSKYEGMMFTDALTRTRELKFGEKLQNHALNNRCNDEFKKFFNNQTKEIPIIRDLDTKRYWINEKLLIIPMGKLSLNIAPLCIEIVDKYVELKLGNFEDFFGNLLQLKATIKSDPKKATDYISKTLEPNSDARLFEIVSYAIIKYHYIDHSITYGLYGRKIEAPLTVYKVGRTNANDGGIDYIMKPLGRIFQVTEVLDFKKYFLDIDKLLHYPITFVVKQNFTPEYAMEKIRQDAKTKYPDDRVLNAYMECFEEIITIPTLKNYLIKDIEKGHLPDIVNEIIQQCKVEYNID